MAPEQILFLGILALALWLFITERLRIDVAAMLVLLLLAVTGLVPPDRALAGFASEPAIIVASVFVLSAGLTATGVTEDIGAWVGRAAGGSEWRAVLVTMPAVAALAAFSHHLMVTAMMLPILLRLARRQNLPASRLLMPMSLAASLGTTLALFSAPAFLLADNLLEQGGREGLHVFSITPIGAALVVLGVVYMLLARWLVPKRAGTTDESDYLRLDRYCTEVVVAGAPWSGRPPRELEARFRRRLHVVGWRRNGARLEPDAGAVLQPNDVLLVNCTPDEIASIGHEPGLALRAIAVPGMGARGARREEPELVQAVVAPRSEFVGQPLGAVEFLEGLGVRVVGLWRRDGLETEELDSVHLQEGDLLVLSGPRDSYPELAQHRGFLMMVPFSASRRQRHRAPRALAIMLGVVAAAASGIVEPAIAFLAGAVAMVMAGCVRPQQAYDEVDVRIYVLIAGMIPLGAAMQSTGTADLFGSELARLTDGYAPLIALLVMFWAASLLTQVMSDAATVALLGPVAIALAADLGLAPEPFVVCTALGAVASFLTPLGHHGNLLILGPGRYTFGEFLRVGVPLTIMIGFVSAWLAQALWLGGPTWPTREALVALGLL